MNRCEDTYRGDRCVLSADHTGLHRNRHHTWRFEDPYEPEWMKRRRTIGLPAKVMPL